MEKEAWYAKSVEEVMLRLRTNLDGLSAAQVAERLKIYGLNKLPEEKVTPWYMLFLSQFNNMLILLLGLAVLVSLYIGHYLDALGISVAILLSVFFGFIQEYRAERSLAALKKILTPKALVIREGREEIIPAEELVPGDILVLSEGEKVPADARLIENIALTTDEASLTGESLPVHKNIAALAKGTSMTQRFNTVYLGTIIVRGRGKAVVTETGMNTEFGQIALSLETTEEGMTPLQEDLGELGKKIGIAGIILCLAFFTLGVLSGVSVTTMFITAVALAVAAIPEGLPTVITITLALGMQKMAREKAIVRKLPAVESLGGVTVICTDKTGTLTLNKMTVQRIALASGAYEVTGSGNSLKGEFIFKGKAGRAANPNTEKELEKALLISALCNNAALVFEKGEGQEERLEFSGDPTESALLVAAEKRGMETSSLRSKHQFLGEIPFDSDRKMMSVVRYYEGRKIAFVKGAPEQLLSRSTSVLEGKESVKLNKERREAWVRQSRQMAENALRLIAVGFKEVKGTDFASKETESELTFVGIMGMLDPPRPEVEKAVHLCQQAGIKVIMITGDSEQTAMAIAKQLKIINRDDEVLSGVALDNFTDTELDLTLNRIRVFSRVTPQHKYRIVSALMKRGERVAVTGDGVNDAPAIKKATVGVSMGITGTDVTKEVADVVLTDDNFATLVNAVRFGRTIYDNIRNFVRYQFSTNVAALVLMFIAAVLTAVEGLPLPLLPLQILWINLIMDGPPALALGLEPPSHGIMQRQPRDPKEKILNAPFILLIATTGLIMAAGTLGLFLLEYYSTQNAARAATIAFTTFVMFQLFNAFNCKSTTSSFLPRILANRFLFLAIFLSFALHLCIIYLPFLQQIFTTVPLRPEDWLAIFLVSSTVLIIEEGRKLIFRRFAAKGAREMRTTPAPAGAAAAPAR